MLIHGSVLTVTLWLLAIHFVADFVLQSHWMASNKSKRWDALTLHVSIYSACFLVFGLSFALITFVTHFATDAVTSRITSRLWAKQAVHNFFVVIGADQLIHQFTLIATAVYLGVIR